jgi:hypothetical protein
MTLRVSWRFHSKFLLPDFLSGCAYFWILLALFRYFPSPQLLLWAEAGEIPYWPVGQKRFDSGAHKPLDATGSWKEYHYGSEE